MAENSVHPCAPRLEAQEVRRCHLSPGPDGGGEPWGTACSAHRLGMVPRRPCFPQAAVLRGALSRGVPSAFAHW